MSEAKHTPGPWTGSGGGYIGICATKDEKPVELAHVFGDTIYRHKKRQPISDEECEANANLICAAPDLLAALRDLTDWLGAVHPDHPLLGLAHRTIAKAEPGSVV